MHDDRLITIAIHTYERAHELKNILECEGISVTLQNVNLSTPVVSSGIRVRIRENDLPLALRLIENIEIFSPSAIRECPDGGPEILVPVDFSPSSLKACSIAFGIAATHKAKIRLLHSYIDPKLSSSAALQLSDSMTFDTTAESMIEMQQDMQLNKISGRKMKEFETMLREKIKDGVIPPVVFSSEKAEGLPEEVITEHASKRHPLLIVMGTRGTDNRQSRDMLGSVTAEVLDSCRSSIFTVPETLRFKSVADIHEIVYFASSRQQDILALDALYRIFPDQSLSVTLAAIPAKKKSGTDSGALENLRAYCVSNYPAYTFKPLQLSHAKEAEEFELLDSDRRIDLIIVPTPHKNIFARLFSPTLAHKLLFHSDIPMLSIPV